jgi:DNA (cytosine-5)-methyltransferase 1
VLKLKAISLFSCGGIGDLALKGSGIEVLLANELEKERAEVFSYNFPEVEMIIGDIWEKKDSITEYVNDALQGASLDIVFATPPCQGMSKNGRGKLLNLVRKGERPKVDPRNQLVIPAIDIFIELKAETLVMENVPEMENTLIPSSKVKGELVSIPDYIIERIGDEYSNSIQVIEFADYSVPQRRQRLISVFSRNKNIKNFIYKFGTIFPPKTHSKKPIGSLKPWITVRDAISTMPALDAKTKQLAVSADIPYHKVPLLDDDKYFWVSNTPLGKSAFDNQCANVKCGFSENRNHGSKHDEGGINKSNACTPIYCENCNSLLPRPWVREGENFRLMKGFVSAYKRMDYDLPSSALTRNLSYACSDNKLHPAQNRVLSIHEACVLHTINKYDFSWKRRDGKKVSDKLVRELIGESIPPYGLQQLFDFFIGISLGRVTTYIDNSTNQIDLIS